MGMFGCCQAVWACEYSIMMSQGMCTALQDDQAAWLLDGHILPTPGYSNVPPAELCDADSHFISCKGLRVHYRFEQPQARPAMTSVHAGPAAMCQCLARQVFLPTHTRSLGFSLLYKPVTKQVDICGPCCICSATRVGACRRTATPRPALCSSMALGQQHSRGATSCPAWRAPPDAASMPLIAPPLVRASYALGL